MAELVSLRGRFAVTFWQIWCHKLAHIGRTAVTGMLTQDSAVTLDWLGGCADLFCNDKLRMEELVSLPGD